MLHPEIRKEGRGQQAGRRKGLWMGLGRHIKEQKEDERMKM